jgi:excinuclease ABC subunit C
MQFDLAEELKKLPRKPGVYIMRDAAGGVIYVGKARSLKNRVSQYFQSGHNHTPKVRMLVSKIRSFEYIVTDSEFEALILECNLIKKNRPRYNVLLKDDKHYPYIRVSMQEPYPTVAVARRVADDGARYFGPYLNVHSIADTIAELRRAFPMKSCKRELPKDIGKGRPCLYYHIGLCQGPCAGGVGEAEYRAAMEDICTFLEGKHDDIVRKAEREMLEASEAMRYELAGKLRDRLFALRHIQEKQKVLSTAMHDQDVVAHYSDGVDTCVSVYFIRGGKLVGREQFLFEGQGPRDARGLLTEFVERFYSEIGFVPREVILQSPVDGMEAFARMLSERRGAKADVVVPVRGEKKALVGLAAKNSRIELENKRQAILAEEGRIREGLGALFGLLGVEPGGWEGAAGAPAAVGAVAEAREAYGAGGAAGGGVAVSEAGEAAGVGGASEADGAEGACGAAGAGEAAGAGDVAEGPVRIEAYDISYFGESDRVASMVVFEDGRPAKQQYKRFKIRTVEGQDDYESMREVLRRRLSNLQDGKAGFAARPDLLLVDGGRGHVACALSVLSELGLGIPVAGMAKNDRHETDSLVSQEGEVVPLAPHPALLRLVSSIQDEAHRFAVAYSKKLAEKRLSLSELDEIPGVGKRRKMALLTHFKSFRAIKAATVEELARAPGVNAATARNIHRHFHGGPDAQGAPDAPGAPGHAPPPAPPAPSPAAAATVPAPGPEAADMPATAPAPAAAPGG